MKTIYDLNQDQLEQLHDLYHDLLNLIDATLPNNNDSTLHSLDDLRDTIADLSEPMIAANASTFFPDEDETEAINNLDFLLIASIFTTLAYGFRA